MSCVDLLQAAGSGDIPWLIRLLDSGCDPNTVHPMTGASALYNACWGGTQPEAVGVLLSRGADPNQSLTYRSPVDGRVEEGVVALMVAGSFGQASSRRVVELLLGAGADPNARMEDGRTVLMRLVGAASSEVVGLLIGAGADVAVRAKDGRSAEDVVKKKLEWWRQFAPEKNLEYQEDLRAILALLEAGGRGGAA